ncbi:transposable element Tcb1 transposase [Trichonephila clavipes]|nr:transposable element Tcb1 transposase [Trichonephila clavipes]
MDCMPRYLEFVFLYPSNQRGMIKSGTGNKAEALWCGQGVSLGYHTDLHIFKRGSVTAVRYRDDVLEPIVRLYAAVVGSTFVLIDNNARPHGADIVDDYLVSEGIAYGVVSIFD